MTSRYIPFLRPAGFATLPEGVKWSYVEAPLMYGLYTRGDLPQSRHKFGIIETDRELTAAEIDHFDLRPWSTIFRDHRCSKCHDGEKPCAQGSPNRCEFPMARND